VKIDPATIGETTLRRQIYVLIAVAALCGVLGRIYTFHTPGVKDRPTPFLSANDRSRWCTIASLVDHGTYAIDAVAFDPETGKRRPGFHTIDMVRHRGPDGQDHYYSSKPVLMPTLLAGLYAVVKFATGTTLINHPFYVGNIITTLANVPALGRVVCLRGVVARGICPQQLGTAHGDGLRRIRHIPDHVCDMPEQSRSWGGVRDSDGDHCSADTEKSNGCRTMAIRAGWFLRDDGFCERTHPALALLAAIALALLLTDVKQTLLYFAPPVVVILLAMVGLNWYGHGDFRPPYSHRNVGAKLADLPLSAAALSETPDDAKRDVVGKAAESANVRLDAGWQLVLARKNGRWVVTDSSGERRYAIGAAKRCEGWALGWHLQGGF